MIEARVEGILLDNVNNSPVVLLRERDGDRVLPIFIGPLEASAIAYALEKTKFPRPLTLDLMRLLVEGLQGHIRRVIITKLENETFFAEVVIEAGDRVVAVDARPSDSVGLALRAEAPIYIAEAVMEKAGQWITAEDEDRLKDLREKMRTMSPEDFGTYKM
ncbi:MAG: bifunctional nuclease family protein [candidate division WOR-3 bacterium]|nr:bifunctional nuclease family protein [candidate division WOR-3 bacterium]